MADDKVKVFFARFPFQNQECPDSTDWFTETMLKAKKDDRIGEVFSKRYDDTPITMTRNACMVDARAAGADLVCMLDSDMRPDEPLPGAKPFWDSSFGFWFHRRKQGPLVIAAPYCGPPPVENVYVFQWARRQSEHPNVDMVLDQFTREEAAFRAGIEEVGALPTGLILIDIRVLDCIAPPWFEYEWTDKFQTHKASTEDVYFTRNLSLAGVPCYVNWDAWADHWKRKCVRKPQTLTVDDVRENMREALLKGRRRNERVLVKPPLTDERLADLDLLRRPDHVDPGADSHGERGLGHRPPLGRGRPDGDRHAREEPLLASQAAG